MQLVKSLSRKYRRYYQGGTYYVGVPGDVPFSWVYFLPKI